MQVKAEAARLVEGFVMAWIPSKYCGIISYIFRFKGKNLCFYSQNFCTLPKSLILLLPPVKIGE